MFSQIVTVAGIIILASRGNCEPPTSHYGTPLAPPISSYGTPNYNSHGNANHGHDQEYNEPKAYEFGYQVKDDYTGNNYNRREASDGNQVRGEYRVQLPDGRTQIVTYYADWQTGFHADVRYEGKASYPDQYQTNTYAPPVHNGYSGEYSGNNNYNAAAATSSVSIKDYSNGGSPYNTNNYHQNVQQNYDSYNSGFNSRVGPTPVYGAP